MADCYRATVERIRWGKKSTRRNVPGCDPTFQEFLRDSKNKCLRKFEEKTENKIWRVKMDLQFRRKKLIKAIFSKLLFHMFAIYKQNDTKNQQDREWWTRVVHLSASRFRQ